MDRVLRAITDDGSFRVVTLETTATARRVLKAQEPDRTTSESLADLVTAVILLRETMAPRLRVQAILKPRDGTGSLVADSHPSGKTRGLVNLPADAGPLGTAGAVLRMMRTLHDGRIHQGVVAIPEGKDVAEALMIYMKESEQIDSMVAVSSVFAGHELQASGGYLIQLLPEVGTGPLAVMVERLEAFRSIKPLLSSASFGPQQLLDELLYAMPHTLLGDSSLRAGCWCNRASVMAALTTLERGDIAQIIDAGTTLEICCDYCGKNYTISPAELHGLRTKS